MSLLLAASVLLPCARTAASIPDGTPPSQEAPLLEKERPVTQKLAGGAAHLYGLNLAAGHFLRVSVEHPGVELSLALFGPAGEMLAESRGAKDGAEPTLLSAIAPVGGDYRLEVCSRETDPFPAAYEIRVTDLRVATSQDRARRAAETAFADGERLQTAGSAESLQAAAARYEEARTQWRAAGDSAGEAKALANGGSVSYALGELPKALESFTRSLTLTRDLGDRSGEAEALNNLGAVYDDLGEKAKALDYYERALNTLRSVGNRASEAGVSNNIGLLYHSLGESQKALEYHEAALAIRESLGDGSGRAESLSNIGLVYQGWGENQKALDIYSRALPLWHAAEDRQGEATTLNNIAGIYYVLGEREKALDEYGRALALARVVGDKRTEGHILNGMGLCHEALSDTPKALDLYEQALELWRILADRRGEATTLDDIGLVHAGSHDWSRALEFYEQALPLERAVGNRGGEGSVLTHTGKAYAMLGEEQKARDSYRQALTLARAIGDRRGEAMALEQLARTERDAGHLIEARGRIEEALVLVDAIRTMVAGRDLRSAYLASVHQSYELYVDILMRLHQLEPRGGWDALALQANERARARSLLELLAESGADIRPGVAPALLDRERDLRRRLSAKLQHQMRLLGGKHGDEEAAAAAREIRDLMVEREQLDVQIRATSPRYAALTQPQPLSGAEIQRAVVDSSTLLLEYALGEERSFLWAVTPTAMTSYALPKRADVESAARRVYDLLTARNRGGSSGARPQKPERIEGVDREYRRAAGVLSRMLLGPVAGQLRGKRLLVVGDGALQYIPFGALEDPESSGGFEPLAARHEIASLPSASTLAILRRELVGRPPAPKTLAVLADPVFDEDDERVHTTGGRGGLKARRPDEKVTGGRSAEALVRSVRDTAPVDGPARLGRLPFTRREAQAILTLVSPDARKAAFDFDASRSTAFSPDLASYRFVHFATHGFLNSLHPELSGIVLSLVDRDGKEQDGFLPATDVFNLRLPADVVVLSGCRTGLGKEIRGEGLVGLTQGFLYAGAARILVSLWEVDDAATATLMERFYRGMLGEKRLSPAAALRAAQMSVRGTKRWQAPYYWAAFVLEGEIR